MLAELTADPSFRGCAFIRTSAESRTSSGVKEICDESRAWLRALFRELAAEAGAVDPEALSQQLVLLYDGAIVGAQMDRDPSAAAAARHMASALFDAATRR